jgi:hypothetical protein
VGLGFALNVESGPGQSQEIVFGYNVSLSPVDFVTFSMRGASATDDGVVTATKDLCIGDFFFGAGPELCGATHDARTLFAIDGDALLDESFSFAPATFLSVFDDIAIDGGLAGSANLNGLVSNQFPITTPPQPVPEPATGLLLAAGLGAVVRRRYHRRSR